MKILQIEAEACTDKMAKLKFRADWVEKRDAIRLKWARIRWPDKHDFAKHWSQIKDMVANDEMVQLDYWRSDIANGFRNG